MKKCFGAICAALLLLGQESLSADLLTPDLPIVGEDLCIPCFPTEYFDTYISAEQIEVDLINPLYSKGVLTTDQGGIITGKDLRVQARKISYLQTETQCTLYCEGDLLVDYKEWTLTGEAFFYDFIAKTGYLLHGKTAAPPWYIGSKRMEISPQGDIFVHGGYLTTSEGPKHDVRLAASHIKLSRNKVATAKNVALLVKNAPLLWLPTMKVDFKNREEIPLAFQFGWGGYLATYVSVLYKFLDWNDLQALARIDGFFKYGMGGGIDTIYKPKGRATEFYTRNYYVKDLPLQTPQQENRWRYQGVYTDKLWKKTISVNATYDFVSDALMAEQYNLNDFALKTAGRTQIEFQRSDPWWIANLFARVRVNSFQSINQQLPSFKLDWRSFVIPHTGIVASGKFSAEYLHYIFGKQITPTNNFDAARVAFSPSFERPFHTNWLTFTPEVGGKGIYYSKNQHGDAIMQGELLAGAKLESVFHRTFSRCKHAVSPYIHYQYLGAPAIGNDNHYIFSIDDGLGAVSRFRFGVRNSFFIREDCKVNRRFYFDLWGNLFAKAYTAFPDQMGFLNLEYIPYQNLHFIFFGGWDFTEQTIDFANPRIEWTAGENFALACEYRHRSKFYWRKADFYNFTLENVRTKEELLHSALSDQRSTLLIRTFFRLNPDWNACFNIRRGWDRIYQPPYIEWETQMEAIIFDHWRFNFTFEKRESDVRYSVALRMDPGPPKNVKFQPRF